MFDSCFVVVTTVIVQKLVDSGLFEPVIILDIAYFIIKVAILIHWQSFVATQLIIEVE